MARRSGMTLRGSNDALRSSTAIANTPPGPGSVDSLDASASVVADFFAREGATSISVHVLVTDDDAGPPQTHR